MFVRLYRQLLLSLILISGYSLLFGLSSTSTWRCFGFSHTKKNIMKRLIRSNKPKKDDRCSQQLQGLYYSYKAFKRFGFPAIVYSTVSKVTVKASRLKLDDNARIITTPMTAKNGEGGNNKEHNITRVALITGSNTGVGFETAKSLAVTHGYEVILACRSEEKGRAASDAINVAIATINANQSNTNSSSTKGKAVFLRPLDLSDLDSVREFCQVVDSQYDTIHVLVNNAGKNTAASPVTSRQQSQISDEVLLDDIFTTNFLGHFLLTNLLLPKCRRIVNLSSVMHHFPIYSKNDEFSDISSIDFWKNNAIEPVQNDSTSASRDRKPYGPSKLAAVLFSIELNRRYGGGSGSDRRIRSIAVNPGSVNSDIWRNYPKFMKAIFRRIYLTPEQGSATSIAAAVLNFDNNNNDLCDDVVYLQPYWLPSSSKVGCPTYPMFEMLGPYIGYQRTTPRIPNDMGNKAAASLFAVCEELAQCKYPE